MLTCKRKLFALDKLALSNRLAHGAWRNCIGPYLTVQTTDKKGKAKTETHAIIR